MKIQLFKHLFSLLLMLIVAFSSCTQEDQESVVLTEGVLFLSGERVRLSGRIYSNAGNEAVDHGFELSISDSFESPMLIQNGSRTSLGAFIGESVQLESNTEYYYRAYAIIEDVIYLGKTKSFLSLTPTIVSYSPESASVNEIIRITGTNFSSKVKVFFGEQEAEVIEIELESTLEVRVPEISQQTKVTLKIVDGASELIFENEFQYIYGEWKPVGVISNTFRFNDPISFSTEAKFIFGLGRNLIDGTLNNKLWEYNIVDETWQQLNFTGSAAIGAFYNDGGYFGAGYLGWTEGFSQNPILSFEFWKYENGVVNYVGDLPFTLYQASSFYNNGNVYVTGGVFNKVNNFKLFKYSEIDNVWLRLNDIPIIINQDLPHFSYEDSEYLITIEGEIWRYDFLTDQWSIVGTTPFAIGTKGVSQVVGSKAYVGLFSFGDELWEYDIINNFWIDKSGINDNKSNSNGGSFVQNEQMGVIRLNPSGTDSDWIQTWEFYPEEF